MKNKITTLPALAAGQVYIEKDPTVSTPNRITIIGVDAWNVRYNATTGAHLKYLVKRHRFEGLVRSGVFVLQNSAEPVSREVELAHELDKAHQENQILRDRVARVRRDLLALLKSL